MKVFDGAVQHDPDAPAVWSISLLANLDLSGLYDPWTGITGRTARSRIRYLAALWPDLPLQGVAERIHRAIGARGLSVRDVRLVLEGRLLGDPSKRTDEVAVEAIQTVGRVLSRGGSTGQAARASGLSHPTVLRIDRYVGLTQGWRDRVLDMAIDAVREGGTSVRQFGRLVGVSKSEAHRIFQRARAVLVELGEVTS